MSRETGREPGGWSQSRLNPIGEGSKIGYALQFVIGEFDVEVALQFRQEIQSLKAVDLQLLEEVIVRIQFRRRHLKMAGGEINQLRQAFVSRLGMNRITFHLFEPKPIALFMADTAAVRCLQQICARPLRRRVSPSARRRFESLPEAPHTESV